MSGAPGDAAGHFGRDGQQAPSEGLGRLERLERLAASTLPGARAARAARCQGGVAVKEARMQKGR